MQSLTILFKVESLVSRPLLVSYSLYGGPSDGREVDIDKLVPGHYTVVVQSEDGVGSAEYHLRTVRARVATGGTLMINVLAHSPCDDAALWARVLDDFAATIEQVEIPFCEVQYTQERPRVHLRLIGLTPGRQALASLDACAA